jgi:hypothetical protein
MGVKGILQRAVQVDPKVSQSFVVLGWVCGMLISGVVAVYG